MPWNESRVSEERLKFIAEVLRAEETMTNLCRSFGISRKTGYKWQERYHAGGPPALVDVSRRPHINPNATPTEIRDRILALRTEHPTWGARKLRARLQCIHPEQHWPAASTIHQIVKRAGLTRTSQRRRVVRFTQPLVEVARPNQVWCMDFKGSFDCSNGERCDTFTVTDAFSRFVLHCQVINSLSHSEVDKLCDELMKKYGMPERIRTDNGTPFSSISGLGISKLSIKWMQLGITHERIEPGKPTQNGRHERLHRTLKEDAATPPAHSLSLQRQRFEHFTKSFNSERPHQALGMRTPASVYSPSERPYPAAQDLITYDNRHIVRPVRRNGTIRWKSKEIFITEVLRRQTIGLLPNLNSAFDVYFGTLHLGTIDEHQAKFTPRSACLSQAHLR